MMVSLGLAAVTALLVGASRPAPWALALLLVVVLSAVWSYAIMMWIKRTDADESVPSLG